MTSATCWGQWLQRHYPHLPMPVFWSFFFSAHPQLDPRHRVLDNNQPFGWCCKTDVMESSAAIPAGPLHGLIFIFISGRFSTNRPTYPHSYRNWSGRGLDNSSRAVCRVVQPDTRFLQRPSTYANTLLVLPVKLVSRLLMFSSRPFFLLRSSPLLPPPTMVYCHVSKIVL